MVCVEAKSIASATPENRRKSGIGQDLEPGWNRVGMIWHVRCVYSIVSALNREPRTGIKPSVSSLAAGKGSTLDRDIVLVNAPLAQYVACTNCDSRYDDCAGEH